MPTLLRHNGIEPWTLPRPWLTSLRPGQTGYLRADPAEVNTIFGGQFRIPREVRTEYVALDRVPAGGFELIDPPDTEDFARVQTTDNTQTQLWLWPMADNTVVTADLIILARRTDADDRASLRRAITAHRQAAGNVTVDRDDAIGVDHKSDAAWAYAVDGSTTNLRVRITGANGKTVSWRLKASIMTCSSIDA